MAIIEEPAGLVQSLYSLLQDEAALSQALPLAKAFFHQAVERFEANRQALTRNNDEQRLQVARLAYDRRGYPL